MEEIKKEVITYPLNYLLDDKNHINKEISIKKIKEESDSCYGNEDFGEISFKEEVSEEFLHRETSSSLTFDIPCAKFETYLPNTTSEVLPQDLHQDKDSSVLIKMQEMKKEVIEYPLTFLQDNINEVNLPLPRSLKVISQTSCLSSRHRSHKSWQNLHTGVNSKSESPENRPNISSIHSQSPQTNSRAICTYQAATKNYLEKHLHTHTGEKHFKCNLCPYRAARKDSLKIHLYTHTSEKPFKCNLCPYQAKTKSKFKIHSYKHTGENPFKCRLCPYQAARKSDFKIHLYTHTGDKPFKCSLCPFQSATKTQLKYHLHTHTGEKPFKCALCPYQAARKKYLRNHLHTHTREKPFKCNLCPYQATEKYKLKIHSFKHTVEKPFKCNHCPYQTTYKGALKSHSYKHTGEKPFKCNFCPYGAATKALLKNHTLSHTGEAFQI